MRSILLLPILLAILCPAEAHAYCLTTNEKEPNGWEPTVTGCWKAGTTIGWPAGPIGFHIDPHASRKVPFEMIERVTTDSFAKWSAVDCDAPGALSTGPVHPAFEVQNLGPGTVDLSGCAPKDGDCISSRFGGAGAISFYDDAWPYSDGASTYALTTVTYRGARVIGVTLEVNTADHDFVEHGPASGEPAALDYVITHESGHFLGIAHSDHPESVMFTRYQNEGDATLRADDRAAICAIRPAAEPESEKGCGCGVPRSSSRGAFAIAIAAMLLWSRRRSK